MTRFDDCPGHVVCLPVDADSQIFRICVSPTTATADMTMRAGFTIDGSVIAVQANVIGAGHPCCNATYSKIDGVTHQNLLQFHLPVCYVPLQS